MQQALCEEIRQKLTSKKRTPQNVTIFEETDQYPKGDDEFSYKSNVEQLQICAAKDNPNIDKITSLMKKTFQTRRFDIAHSSPSSAQLIELYPTLKTTFGVSFLYVFSIYQILLLPNRYC